MHLASLIKCYRTFGSDKCPAYKKYYIIPSAEGDYAHAHSIRRPLFGIRLTSLPCAACSFAGPSSTEFGPRQKMSSPGISRSSCGPSAGIRADEIRNRIRQSPSLPGSANPTAFRFSIILPFDRVPYLNRTNAQRVKLIDLHGAPLFRLSPG